MPTGTAKAKTGHDLADLLFRLLTDTAEGDENLRNLSDCLFHAGVDSPAVFSALLDLVEDSVLRKSPDKHIASRYLSIISPLCERVGMFERKTVLDDESFRVTDPKAYADIERLLHSYQKSSVSVVAKAKKSLRQLVAQTGLICDITGRYKQHYSIHRKVQVHGKEALSLFDIFGFRIILKSQDPEACFQVLSVLHDTYTPIAWRFKDYISIPKVNGYQSLHTVLRGVVSDLEMPVEVQIRTQAMHEFSEHGMASHWVYATKKKSNLLTEKEQKLVRHLQSERSERDVFCLSPKRDLIRLPAGATVRSFAHTIHSSLAAKASHALINGRRRDIDSPVHDGDLVQIVVS